jgi:pyruvate carboxylase
MKQYLFTYGTLSTGVIPREIAPTFKKLKYVGDGVVNGKLYDLGDFPGIVLSKSPRNKVHGHIFELPDDPSILANLDEYEEFSAQRHASSLFIRKQIPVQIAGGTRVKCWIYVYNREVSRSDLIPSGDYAQIAA